MAGKSKGRKNGKKGSKINIYLSAVIAILILLFGERTISNNSSTPIINTKEAGSTEVHFLDVGQADCILIKSEDEYMLVDAGNNADEQFILDYLKAQGVKKLKYVIGTHPHEDHIGSLDSVINSFEVENVLLPDIEHTTKTFEDVLTSIADKNLEITVPEVNETYDLGSSIFVILAPVNYDYGSELNNYSIGIKLINGNNSFAMFGDAEADAEQDILQSGIDIAADVYKVSHHGSSTSTTDEFLNNISPIYAVISCGKDNDYGHPHEETLEKLLDKDIKIYRTDTDGTVVFYSDGNNITVNK